jgi:hypothetical protein
MKIEELKPFPKDKVHFNLSSFKSVPKDCGCYVLTTFDNMILYIGLSDNLYKRFLQHLDNPEKTNPTNEGKAIWFYYMIYNPKNLEQLERTWLNSFTTQHGRRPILNKVDSPVH